MDPDLTVDPNQRPRLSRRDYLVLPLLSVLTIALMLGASEAVTRTIWPEHMEDNCLEHKTMRHKPNCTVKLKIAEGQEYTKTYNECGYRSDYSCGPKPPDHIRIAFLGSSIAEGDGVAYDKTIAGLTEKRMTQACHRTVEVQNVSAKGLLSMDIYRRTGEALALKPDVLLVTMNPKDTDQLYTDKEMADRNKPLGPAEYRVAHQGILLATLHAVARLKLNFRTAVVLEHFVFQDQSRYLKLYLASGDQSDFLRQPFSPLWQKRFQQLDTFLGEMADQAHAQGVPIVFMSSMQRAQVGFLSEKHLPPGVDPYAYERQFEQISAKHGIIDIDAASAFSKYPKSSNLYYAVDQHPIPKGNEIFTDVLTRGLLSSNIPAFEGCRLPDTNVDLDAMVR